MEETLTPKEKLTLMTTCLQQLSFGIVLDKDKGLYTLQDLPGEQENLTKDSKRGLDRRLKNVKTNLRKDQTTTYRSFVSASSDYCFKTYTFVVQIAEPIGYSGYFSQVLHLEFKVMVRCPDNHILMGGTDPLICDALATFN